MKPSRFRSSRRVAAIALIAAFGVAACESQPSSRRVAEDLVKTLAEDPVVRDCMLDIIDTEYPGDTLDDIGKGVEDGDPQAIADLEVFEERLESCR